MTPKNPSNLLEELKVLIRSRYGLIIIDTLEEMRANRLLRLLSAQMDLPLFVWEYTAGLRRSDLDKAIYRTNEPAVALAHIASVPLPALYHFMGLGPYLEQTELQSRLLAVAQKFENGVSALILTGRLTELQEPVKLHAAQVKMPLPGRPEFTALLKQLFQDISKQIPLKNELTGPDQERLIAGLQGLTLLEAKKLLTRAMIEDGKLNAEDIAAMVRLKKDIIAKDGLLEYDSAEQSMTEVADLSGLKAWLAQRKQIIVDPENARKFGLTFPKGILLLGVPGTGKSLCAKAVATEWRLPLLKMDPANLYDKYIGQSERNFKQALQTAEKMAPVILFIDEIEKVFAAGGAEDGGTSQRILGSFLSWLQDRQGDVFVVATANDITRLPPEFLRKGRFDEIFFVDLPDAETREAIFRIHLQRRGHDPQTCALPHLAQATDGFSGAEIEQVVVSALYACFAAKQPLTPESLTAEIQKTCPLSRTRAEHIAQLREWAQTRTVRAN